MRFEEFSLTRINIKVFWDVVTCSIAERYGHLEKICCLTTLNLEAEVSSETSVPRSVPTLYSFSSQTTITYWTDTFPQLGIEGWELMLSIEALFV